MITMEFPGLSLPAMMKLLILPLGGSYWVVPKWEVGNMLHLKNQPLILGDSLLSETESNFARSIRYINTFGGSTPKPTAFDFFHKYLPSSKRNIAMENPPF